MYCVDIVGSVLSNSTFICHLGKKACKLDQKHLFEMIKDEGCLGLKKAKTKE